jgi:hypothetical protein
MTVEGPIIDIVVSVSEPRRQALQSAGKPVPPPICIRALIDTGATSTNIVASVIQPLGLSANGAVQVVTPSTGSAPVMVDEYDLSILIVHPELGKVFDTVPILECQPLSNDYQALLGRDLLKYCSFFYNGPADAFSLAF